MPTALRYFVFTVIYIAVAVIFLAFLTPRDVHAQTNLGQSADQQCIAQCAQQKQIADQKKDPSLNCPTIGKTVIACKAVAPGGGTVTGQCIYGVGCKALTASGTDGKSGGVGDLSSLMQALGSLMKSLGQGGGGGGSPSPSPMPTGTGGCTTYYQVSTPSSDPCAYYVPSLGSTTNINLNGNGSTNIDLGNTGGNSGDTSGGNPITNIISDLLGGNTDTNTNTSTSSNDNSSGSTATAGGVSSSTAQGATSVGPAGPGGANGEIRVLPNGATIIISNQNNSGNSVTAGFLGTQATGGMQPSGIAASWCRTRPWASNFLSYIIPATFFDSLCTLRGFQVGDSAQAGGPAQIGNGSGSNNIVIHNPGDTGTSSYVWGSVPQGPQIEANIWAVPAAVPLGGRTTIYWNSKNASSCTETSPDGSFSQNTLAGGGATVPLSGPTTFTISCMAADGSHTTADVLVHLSL